jgi:hypothetical protein
VCSSDDVSLSDSVARLMSVSATSSLHVMHQCVLSLDVSLSDFVAHLMSVFSVFVVSCQCSMCSSFVVSCHCVRLSNFVACCRLINVYTNPSQYLSFSGPLFSQCCPRCVAFLGWAQCFSSSVALAASSLNPSSRRA